ncbi:MAG TPA: hypothetical protein VFT98_05150 [Myxococcota bacterium]|nr:hypothetical protein [Myxococcota bacterium]
MTGGLISGDRAGGPARCGSFVQSYVIEGLPPLNTAGGVGRAHWSVQRRSTKDWHWKVKAAVGTKRPEKPLQRARVSFVRFSAANRAPDDDNLRQSFKAVRDGLVHAGVIEDDSSAHLVAEYAWKPCKRGHGCISIYVEEIA